MFSDFEANNDSPKASGALLGFANQHSQQSQRHAMRAENRGSSSAAVQFASQITSQQAPYPSLPNQSVQYTGQQCHQASGSSGAAAQFASQLASQQAPYPAVPNQSVQYTQQQFYQPIGSSIAAAQLASQQVPYPSAPNQSVQYTQQKFRQARGSSSSRANQYPSSQQETLLHANHSKKRGVDKEKKREIDKASRLRCKEKEKEQNNSLHALDSETKILNSEIESFKKQKLEKDQTMQSYTEEQNQLKNDIGQLRRKYDQRNVLLEALVEHVAHPHQINIQLGKKDLKDIIAALRQTPNQENHLLQLFREENKKLKEKGRRLKVQKQALCEKIINDEGRTSKLRF